MAKLPDGYVIIINEDFRKNSIDFTTKELITCKNCRFCVIEDIFCDIDGVKTCVSKNTPICKFASICHSTSLDGYCDMARKLGDNNG